MHLRHSRSDLSVYIYLIGSYAVKTEYAIYLISRKRHSCHPTLLVIATRKYAKCLAVIHALGRIETDGGRTDAYDSYTSLPSCSVD